MDKEDLQKLISAIYAISHGDSVPMGLEALSMSIAGDGLDAPLGRAIESAGQSIYEGLHELAEAIRETNHTTSEK